MRVKEGTAPHQTREGSHPNGGMRRNRKGILEFFLKCKGSERWPARLKHQLPMLPTKLFVFLIALGQSQTLGFLSGSPSDDLRLCLPHTQGKVGFSQELV